MVDRSVIHSLTNALNTDLESVQSYEELQARLAAYLNALINSDFNGLLNLLYRLDVDESKIRVAMKDQKGIDAGLILARIVIERQIKKIETRKKPGNDPGNEIDENEKW
jgi:hypothetical protein